LDWNPAGTFLTAISAGNLSRCFSLKPDTNEVIGGFNGGMKYAELGSFQKGDIPPSCSCFSVDGGLVMTGYSDGTLMTRSAGETDKGLTLSCSKIMNQFLPGKVDQIVPHPHNSSVFAIEVAPPFSLKTNVLIALVNHDGSVTIFATIQDAKSPYFHKDWLLVSSGNKILFHHMNRCNIPCLVTEFHLQGNGTMRVEIDAFCVKTAPDGKIKLYYSLDGKLYTAEITLG
jgi:WD40 repeat protein